MAGPNTNEAPGSGFSVDPTPPREDIDLGALFDSADVEDSQADLDGDDGDPLWEGVGDIDGDGGEGDDTDADDGADEGEDDPADDDEGEDDGEDGDKEGEEKPEPKKQEKRSGRKNQTQRLKEQKLVLESEIEEHKQKNHDLDGKLAQATGYLRETFDRLETRNHELEVERNFSDQLLQLLKGFNIDTTQLQLLEANRKLALAHKGQERQKASAQREAEWQNEQAKGRASEAIMAEAKKYRLRPRYLGAVITDLIEQGKFTSIEDAAKFAAKELWGEDTKAGEQSPKPPKVPKPSGNRRGKGGAKYDDWAGDVMRDGRI